MFKLKISTDNAAFEGDNFEYEITRILREIARKISSGQRENSILDINGNKVGEFTLNKR